MAYSLIDIQALELHTLTHLTKSYLYSPVMTEPVRQTFAQPMTVQVIFQSQNKPGHVWQVSWLYAEDNTVFNF